MAFSWLAPPPNASEVIHTGSCCSCAAILPPDQQCLRVKSNSRKVLFWLTVRGVVLHSRGMVTKGTSAVAAEGQAAGILHPYSGSRERWTADAALTHTLPFFSPLH